MAQSIMKNNLTDAVGRLVDGLPAEKLAIANKKYHFIGAGGVGMSGLAKLVMENGGIVTGSDQEESVVIQELCGLGGDVKTGHQSSNLPEDVDAVVISAAIKDDNPELVAARKNGCKVYKYARILGRLMDCYTGIAVCGTHGKSTTGGWLTFVLKQAGVLPNFIIGADILQLGGSSGAGGGKYFIAEACEYDRSFLNLHPGIAVILNIEQDHLDYYKDEDEIVGAFEDFTKGILDGGVIIANGQDPNVAKVLKKIKPCVAVRTFGLDPKFDFYPENIQLVDGLYHFDICCQGKTLGRTSISLPGDHNILNALAVTAAAVAAGVDEKTVLEELSKFTGMDRRLMLKAHLGGVTVLDDYAHHPTEICASLQGIRQRYEPRKIWCVFQPHQYSRTRFLLDDFAESFKLADMTIVPKIYFVRDTHAAKQEINSQVLIEHIRGQGSEAIFIDNFSQICEYLKTNVKSGDVVVTMGAGDIWKVTDEYIQWLREDS